MEPGAGAQDKLQPVSVVVPEESATAGSLVVAAAEGKPDAGSSRPGEEPEPEGVREQEEAASEAGKVELPATVRPLGGEEARAEEGAEELSLSEVYVDMKSPRLITDGESGSIPYVIVLADNI